MALFGVENWCQRGEVFSVYFGMFSQLGRFGVRTAGSAAAGRSRRPTHWATVPGSAALVIASIASTSFDGAQEGAFKSGIADLRMAGRRRPQPDHLAAAHQFALPAALLRGVGLFWARDLRDAHGSRRTALRAALGIRPRVHPDRARLPGRPLLQPLRLPGAGAVHLPALRPARHRDAPTSSAPRPRGIDFNLSAPTRSGTSRSARCWSATSLGLTLAHDRALAYWRDYRQAAALPVLDAGGDGRLHLLRPLPALRWRVNGSESPCRWPTSATTSGSSTCSRC